MRLPKSHDLGRPTKGYVARGVCSNVTPPLSLSCLQASATAGFPASTSVAWRPTRTLASSAFPSSPRDTGIDTLVYPSCYSAPSVPSHTSAPALAVTCRLRRLVLLLQCSCGPLPASFPARRPFVSESIPCDIALIRSDARPLPPTSVGNSLRLASLVSLSQGECPSRSINPCATPIRTDFSAKPRPWLANGLST